jgi:hypothetical protein
MTVMTTNTITPIRGHRPDRTSVTTPHAVAATLRSYLADDETTFTREELLRSRGWDQRHRRYRRRDVRH